MANLEARRNLHVAIVMPVYDDWASFERLVADLGRLATRQDVEIDVVAVDDGSIEQPRGDASDRWDCESLRTVDVLRLAGNQGHQRAIAIGLAEVLERGVVDAVIVMDSDGEDRPDDAIALLARHRAEPDRIIVVTRAKRSEGPSFRVFYAAYKSAFRLLTGRTIDFGNFCLVPASLLGRLVWSPDLWNHLAATLIRSRLPLLRQGAPRGTRYAGASKMNLVSLLIHGMSAISVFSDAVFVRALMASLALACLTAVVSVAVLGVRLATDLALPNWPTTVIGAMAVIFTQAMMFSAGAIFLHLNRRSTPSVIPAKAHADYVSERLSLYRREGSAPGAALRSPKTL